MQDFIYGHEKENKNTRGNKIGVIPNIKYPTEYPKETDTDIDADTDTDAALFICQSST